jgi:lysyl-tRNA synthetase class I
MPFTCFSCLKQIETMTYRAFDQNFCSNLCLKATMEVNQYLDASFQDPYKWIKSIDEIETVKKQVREEKIKKECTKVLNNLIDDISKNETANTNNIQQIWEEKNNYQHKNINYFYHVPITPPTSHPRSLPKSSNNSQQQFNKKFVILMDYLII